MASSLLLLFPLSQPLPLLGFPFPLAFPVLRVARALHTDLGEAETSSSPTEGICGSSRLSGVSPPRSSGALVARPELRYRARSAKPFFFEPLKGCVCQTILRSKKAWTKIFPTIRKYIYIFNNQENQSINILTCSQTITSSHSFFEGRGPHRRIQKGGLFPGLNQPGMAMAAITNISFPPPFGRPRKNCMGKVKRDPILGLGGRVKNFLSGKPATLEQPHNMPKE